MLHTQPGWNQLCVVQDFSRHLQSEGTWIKGELARMLSQGPRAPWAAWSALMWWDEDR